jgi:hypothetical protein
MKNLGVIIEQKPKDWAAGSLPYEILNPTGDWTAYLPSDENQATHLTDSMACVTFSCLNVIETQYKFFTGKDINFSDRFIAKLSGTTPQGNSVQKVLDAINEYGLVLEEEWPTDLSFDWNKYYADIPQEVRDKANKNIKVQYEFHYQDFAKELKHAPLEMIIETNKPYHSVEMVNTTQQFDSYTPNLRPQKSIYLATKILVKGLPMTNAKLIQVGQEYGYWMPATTPDGFKSMGLNFGEVLPEKPDGTIDFSKVTPDYKI